MDAIEDVGEVGLRVDVVHFCRDDESVHGGGPLTAALGAGEEPVFPTDGQFPFILPMSGRFTGFIINGMPILART